MRGARTFVVAAFRHVTGHFVRTNPNTTATGLANSTALRLGLVRVSVADELLQCFEVLAACERLVILFDKGDGHVSRSPKRADYTDIPEIL